MFDASAAAGIAGADAATLAAVRDLAAGADLVSDDRLPQPTAPANAHDRPHR
jgi:hypothetical protein